MKEKELEAPLACQQCSAEFICECDGLFANCEHGKELDEYLVELRKREHNGK